MAKKEQKKVAAPEAAMPVMTDFPTIKKGATGGYVTVAQANLKNRGYDIGEEGIDGIFGEKTHKAVREFQKDLGLPIPNGVIGPKMWDALQNSEVNRLPKPVENEPVVGNYRVLIEGLTRYQAELLVMLLRGSTECHIV